MHPLYREWLQFVFAYEESNPRWYFEPTEEEAIELLRETFTRSGEDLIQFSDYQVKEGIRFLVCPGESDYTSYAFSTKNSKVPISAKIAAVRSIYDLYRNCFAARCPEVLAHLDEPGGSDLNSICYMFWDISPMPSSDDSADANDLEDAIFSVLSDTIRIPHRACIEGGLHGLGHMAADYEARVQKIIDDYLRTAKIDEALRGYAERARYGGIQ